MPRELQLLREGEVDFRLRSNKDEAAWYYTSSHPKRPRQPDSLLGWLVIIAATFLLLAWLTSCGRRDNLVSVRTSDGKIIKMTPEDAQSEAVTGEEFSWDWTKNPNPPEPGLGTNLPPNPEDQRLDARGIK